MRRLWWMLLAPVRLARTVVVLVLPFAKRGSGRVLRRPSLWTSAIAGAVVYSLVVILALLLLPARMAHGQLTPAERADAEADARTTILQAAGGFLLLPTLLFTARNVWLTREAQLTDRYIRSVEQLGAAELERRIGAIFALERIARDSARDHWTIMEVLTAFVRERAQREPTADQNVTSVTDWRPASDVQAALSVVGRRNVALDPPASQGRVDLSRTDLRGAFLDDASLDRADFSRANLDGASLQRTRLEAADFWGASVEVADLREASLVGTNLEYARLKYALLDGADLYLAWLFNANFEGASLTQGELVLAASWAKATLPSDLKHLEYGGPGQPESKPEGG